MVTLLMMAFMHFCSIAAPTWNSDPFKKEICLQDVKKRSEGGRVCPMWSGELVTGAPGAV